VNKRNLPAAWSVAENRQTNWSLVWQGPDNTKVSLAGDLRRKQRPKSSRHDRGLGIMSEEFQLTGCAARRRQLFHNDAFINERYIVNYFCAVAGAVKSLRWEAAAIENHQTWRQFPPISEPAGRFTAHPEMEPMRHLSSLT